MEESETKMRCHKCRYWLKIPLEPVGQCRESSPVPICIGMSQLGKPVVMGYHPPTSGDHYCFKFKPKLEVIDA